MSGRRLVAGALVLGLVALGARCGEEQLPDDPQLPTDPPVESSELIEPDEPEG